MVWFGVVWCGVVDGVFGSVGVVGVIRCDVGCFRAVSCCESSELRHRR